METTEFAGKKFQYEKLMPEHFKNGTCAFKVIDEDGDTQYLVFTPNSLSEQVEGKEIKTLNDGTLCAACPTEESALMVASSICIAANVAHFSDGKAKAIKENIEEIAKGLGFDLDAMKEEIVKLRKEGKSTKEIQEIMKSRMEEFRKKGGSPSTDKGGEW